MALRMMSCDRLSITLALDKVIFPFPHEKTRMFKDFTMLSKGGVGIVMPLPPRRRLWNGDRTFFGGSAILLIPFHFFNRQFVCVMYPTGSRICVGDGVTRLLLIILSLKGIYPARVNQTAHVGVCGWV